jgi:hypothetical protein
MGEVREKWENALKGPGAPPEELSSTEVGPRIWGRTRTGLVTGVKGFCSFTPVECSFPASPGDDRSRWCR